MSNQGPGREARWRASKIGPEIFRGEISNAPVIQAADGGFAQFSGVVNSDPAVFEVLSTGNFGVRFNQEGVIQWDYQQSLIGNGGNYVFVTAQVSGQPTGPNTLVPANSVWQGLSSSGVDEVTVGDILTFNFQTAGGNLINAMSSAQWGTLGILWMPQRLALRARRSTPQEAHPERLKRARARTANCMRNGFRSSCGCSARRVRADQLRIHHSAQVRGQRSQGNSGSS